MLGPGVCHGPEGRAQSWPRVACTPVSVSAARHRCRLRTPGPRLAPGVGLCQSFGGVSGPAGPLGGSVRAECGPPCVTLVRAAGGDFTAVLVLDVAGTYLHRLFVDPDCQGQGVGAELLQQVHRLCPGGWT